MVHCFILLCVPKGGPSAKIRVNTFPLVTSENTKMGVWKEEGEGQEKEPS